MTDSMTTDVAIIGSGVAGALIATRLAEQGLKVTILEAGDEVDRSSAVDRYWAAAIKVPECPYPPVPQAMHPVSDDLDFWYQQNGTRQVRQHLHQDSRRNHLALARHRIEVRSCGF